MSFNRKPNLNLFKQYEEQGACCFYCKEKIDFDKITRDHFLPKTKGNTFLNNKVFACKLCNNIKGHKTIEELKTYCEERIELSEITVLKFINPKS